MIKGIGIDIIEVSRIKGIIEKYGDKFFQRILTENEISYCKSYKANSELHFAGRFASKEAYSKSIGTGISKTFGWKDIEILNDPRANLIYTISKNQNILLTDLKSAYRIQKNMLVLS